MMVQYTAGLLTRMLPRLSQSQDMLAWVTSLGLLSRKLSELRTWMRLFGLLPILQWYRDLHTMPTPKSDTFTETSMTSRRLLRIEKLQAWSMLVYYPLEHYVLLATHKIVPEAKPATMAKLSLWSVRAWAAYVVLQLAHISEERRLLAAKQSWIQSCSDVHAAARMYRNSEAKAKALRTDAIINLAYLPMTIHWYVWCFLSAQLKPLEMTYYTRFTGHFRKVYTATKPGLRFSVSSRPGTR